MIENKFLNLSVKWLGGRHAVLVFRVFPVKKVCQKGVSVVRESTWSDIQHAQVGGLKKRPKVSKEW